MGTVTSKETYPLTEEIRLEIFSSPDYTVSPYHQGTPVSSRENMFEIFGTPVKPCLKVGISES